MIARLCRHTTRELSQPVESRSRFIVQWSLLPVKNLLTVLSSRGGGLGSTQAAATEDKVTDKRAEKTHSD